MPAPPDPITIRVVSRICELDAAQWDACAGSDDPFVSHAFLDALEQSESAVQEHGWLAHHLTVENEAGKLLGVVPAYLKLHSYGEYVFDFGWARAYETAGMRYYPKLQSCVPFSPVTGPRLLVHPDADREQVQQLLVVALIEIAKRQKLSSMHITFATKSEWEICGEVGLLQRIGVQYHWRNDGYDSFDDFLGTLLARKRKALKKERRLAQESGVKIEALRGDDIKAHHWDAFHEFYLRTIDKKYASAYLTRDFFQAIGESMSDRIVLLMGECDGELVSGALNLLGGKALYGRYWGCVESHRYVHFETCYHRAIELAIELGLERVEAGAQGPHKIQRGYLPVETYSAHWISHPEFRQVIGDFLDRERVGMRREIQTLMEDSPYRADRAASRAKRDGSGGAGPR
jgi:predicted N-acyltransferase